MHHCRACEKAPREAMVEQAIAVGRLSIERQISLGKNAGRYMPLGPAQEAWG